MTEVKRRNPGDPFQIRAGEWNAISDLQQAGRAVDAGDPQRLRVFRQSGVVRVRNDSGTDVDRFGVLSIRSPLIALADNKDEYWRAAEFSGTTPTDGDEGAFGILLEPAADGSIGRAVAAGVVRCQVDISDVTHGFAEIDPDNTDNLVSATWGSAQILERETTYTGLMWCTVRLGNAPIGGATLNIYSTNTQKWDTADSSVGYSTPYGPEHPVEFDVTRIDNSNNLFTVRQHTDTFASKPIAWSSVEVLRDGDFDFVYGLSGMTGVDPNSRGYNPIHCWLQESSDAGATWTDVNATHTDQSIDYVPDTFPQGDGAGCELSLGSTFVTSAPMTLSVTANHRYRLWVKTDDDSTYQRWEATNSYLHVRKCG